MERLLLFLLWLAHWFSIDGPTTLGIWTFIISFVAASILQFYGHYLEGKKPAFMDNIAHAFVAPLYMTAELFFMAGYMLPLKEEIYGAAELTDKDLK